MPVVDLDDVKTFLNIRGSSDDDELLRFMQAALGVVEDQVGSLGSQTVSEDIFGPGMDRIVLNQTPVLSVQSVLVAPWVGQTPTDDTDTWVLDSRAGILRRKLTGGYWGFYGPSSVATVAYTVGRTTVPEQLVKAVLYVLEAMWRSQRGASPLPAGGDQPMPPVPGYMIPPKAMEAMLPYLKPPGLA